MNKNTVLELMKKHRIVTKKKFGQNFLIDQNIVRNIVDVAKLDKETLTIEIGPGLGVLTEHLLKSSKQVLAYEIDNTLIPHLKEQFKDRSFTLIHDDILKRNLDDDIKALEGEFKNIVVVANLPYYITTPILMKCLEESKYINKMVFMVQYEVARRITAKPKTKDYNALTLSIQYRAKTHYHFKVPKTVFIPSPNVDSAIISLDFYETPPISLDSEQLFFKLIKTAFRQRRKTLLNNLYEIFSHNKEELSEHLIYCQIDPNRRAESLDLEDFARLANYFNSLK